MNEAFFIALAYWHGGCSLVITTRDRDLGKKTVLLHVWRSFMNHKRDMYQLDRTICKEAGTIARSSHPFSRCLFITSSA